MPTSTRAAPDRNAVRAVSASRGATVAGLLEPYRGRRRLGGIRLTVDIDPIELP